MTDRDVLFEKGEADSKTAGPNPEDELWFYPRGEITFVVRFEQGVTASLIASSRNPSQLGHRDASETDFTLSDALEGTFRGVLGIQFGDIPSTITAYLGEPDSILELNEGATRRYEYLKEFNVAFSLERGRVVSIAVGGYN